MIIIAAYVSEERLAQLLRDNRLTGFPYHAHQYSSNGPVPGIVGRCDMNMIHDRAAFDIVAGYGNQPKEEEDMKPILVTTGDGGIWLCAPGICLVPFASIEDAQAVSKAYGINVDSDVATITAEQFDRFLKSVPNGSTGGTLGAVLDLDITSIPGTATGRIHS